MSDTAVPAEELRELREPPDSAVCDVIGALLLASCAAWTVYAAAGREAQPEAMLLGLLAVAAGYATGRIAGALAPVGALATPALAAAVLAPTLGPRLLDDEALAALLTLAVGAACCAAHAAREGGASRGARRWAARACLGLALVLALESLLTQALAGVLGCAAALLVAGSAHRARRRTAASLLLAGAVLLAVVSTVLVAELGSDGAPVSPERVTLWRAALHDLAQQPLRGIGPGDFGAGSASSAALQTAAEQGWPGVLLLGCAFVWTLWTLARSPRPTPLALAAAGALSALGVQAAVSPVLGAPTVTAAAGLLLGLAVARP